MIATTQTKMQHKRRNCLMHRQWRNEEQTDTSRRHNHYGCLVAPRISSIATSASSTLGFCAAHLSCGGWPQTLLPQNSHGPCRPWSTMEKQCAAERPTISRKLDSRTTDTASQSERGKTLVLRWSAMVGGRQSFRLLTILRTPRPGPQSG